MQATPSEENVDTVARVTDALLQLLIQMGNLILAAIVAVELWLRAQFTLLGVSPAIQTVLLVAIAVLLIVAALRLFGGLIRVAVVLVLLLIVIHVVLPIIQHG
ncbi:MAG: hypothetical protein QOG73_2599 [Acetobacteraceae bacterium]|jgi:hypothetical protein|nr:hypothetical protein [Acetobacteraceae bacterium]